MNALLSSFGAIAVVASSACAGSMGAVEQSSDHVVTVQQPVDSDLMTAGQTVNIESEIHGDLTTAGQNVTIAGPVAGYVMTAGRNVTVNSHVDNDLWAAGETVTVDGQVGDTATVAGRTVHLGHDAVVGGDARLAGNTVQVDGRIERDLSIGAATAVIDGQVGGNVEARAERVSLLPGIVINGDLIVHASRPPEISPQARVNGQVRYSELERGGYGGWLGMWLFGFLALLILGLPLLVFAPRWAPRIAEVMTARFGLSMAAGLALIIVVPLAIVLLAVTIVGIPLAAVLAALYFVVLAGSGVFVSYEVGAWVFARMRHPSPAPWQRLAVGAAIVSFAISLPAVGWLFAILVVMLGVGALFLERRAARMAMA